MFRTTRSVRTHNIICMVIAAVCVFTILFVSRPFFAIGDSMEPTLKNGQLVICMPRLFNPFLKLQRGDVVLVHSEQRGAYLVKRLIGFPGDTVEIRNNRVYVNGKTICERYLGEPMVTPDVEPFVLEEDMYYVLGDNRNVSADSRTYGPFSENDIYAVVYVERQAIQIPLVIVLIVCLFIFGWFLPEQNQPEPDPVQQTGDTA